MHTNRLINSYLFMHLFSSFVLTNEEVGLIATVPSGLDILPS